jgi:hypothetical protein
VVFVLLVRVNDIPVVRQLQLHAFYQVPMNVEDILLDVDIDPTMLIRSTLRQYRSTLT